MPESLKIHAFRLVPGQDLKAQIDAYVQLHHIEAGWVMTCVGSLTHYHLRFANQAELVLGESPNLVFTRENDGTTLWKSFQRVRSVTRAPSPNPFSFSSNTPGVLPTSRLPSESSKPSASAPLRVAHRSNVSKGT